MLLSHFKPLIRPPEPLCPTLKDWPGFPQQRSASSGRPPSGPEPGPLPMGDRQPGAPTSPGVRGRLTNHASVGAQTRLVIVGRAAGKRLVGGTTIGVEVCQPGPSVRRPNRENGLVWLPSHLFCGKAAPPCWSPEQEEARKMERTNMEGDTNR